MANSIPADVLADQRRYTYHPGPKLIEDGMRALGWHDGKNVRYVWKTVAGDYDKWPQVVAEMVNLKPAVIVVFSDTPAKMALERTKTIPIVLAGMGSVLDPKIVHSLKRPGVNLTGLSIDGLNLGAKRLELLKSVVPGIKRLVVLVHGKLPAAEAPFLSPQTAALARDLRIEPFLVTFPTLADLPAAFAQIIARRADALMIGESPQMYYREYQVPIHDFAMKHRLPAMWRILNAVESGGLMAYAPDILEFYRTAPRYIDKLLKGEKASEIPIQTPDKFEFVINLKTAKAMGLVIPSFPLSIADRVIS